MARLCAIICTSHSPYLYAAPSEWEPARSARHERGGIAEVVPIDSGEANHAKHARAMAAMATLREALETSRPDVLLILGDDQSEQFGFDNYPAFSVYAGDTFSGYRISPRFGLPVPGATRQQRPRTAEHWMTANGDPQFARSLIVGLVEQGFDVGFSLGLPRPDDGIGHAFMRPLHSLTPQFQIPAVPLFVNCYFGPQPTGNRCAALGRALRDRIAAMPGDTRVAVIGSGGLWHTPMVPQAYLDEAFDSAMIEGVRAGDAQAMADYFDSRRPTQNDLDPRDPMILSGGTGMVLGLGGGSGECRNWIIATAMASDRPGTVIDYIPAYASPVGLGFAYWSFA